ncbi:peptide/nickel transport system substrate-binding protein [Halobiforma haloterrestris]|uniref:Peptide/nickel transport system substrate-binding protein n=2 Tax=Natronobacterium haloterrestre TaxID=148448 RepID=A0A1I1G1D2_NATHA|nr:peptide/nickel transport system substrate-binding protein [Halobiforma haloterrestris]
MLAATGLTAAMAGCVREVRNAVNRDGIDQLSLTITTLPADGDRESIQLSRAIRNALEAVGVDVSIAMRSHEEFLRETLINHEFDVYVGRYPTGTDPSYLYEALHSRYADEAGWQNPFGFTNLTFDQSLERQRDAGDGERRDAVAETLSAFAAEQPFVPICAPREYRLARTDRFDGWGDRHPATPLGYLGLEALDRENGSGNDDSRLRAVHTDARPSQNLNPLSAEYRNRGLFTGLLYDTLAVDAALLEDSGAESDGEDGEDGEDRENREDGEDGEDRENAAEEDEGDEGETGDENPDRETDANDADATGPDLRPWLADSWTLEDDVLTVRLREDCPFHDGRQVTADDVAFTYRFLADTTLGDDRVPTPSPRHRGQVAPLEAVEAAGNDREIAFRFRRSLEDASAAVAGALTVPILPEHVWRERSAAADVTGVRIAEGVTEALVVDNVPPIGSGPFAFADRTDREHVTLERNDDHFTLREGVDLPAPTASEMRVAIDPRSTSAVELVSDDDADVTTSTLESYVLDDVIEAADEADDLEVLESSPRSFYHLGFNARKAPFSNPRFRRTVARLIDKAWIVDEVFDGYARPIAAPLVDQEWVPDDLAWGGDGDGDPATPFLGQDGEVDVEAARAAFEAAGFRYDTNGRLRTRVSR